MSNPIPSEIQELADKGVLRYISELEGEHEWVIDALKHTRPTSTGPEEYVYSVYFDSTTDGEGENPYKFRIMEQNEGFADNDMLYSNDVDEVVCWIEENVADRKGQP